MVFKSTLKLPIKRNQNKSMLRQQQSWHHILKPQCRTKTKNNFHYMGTKIIHSLNNNKIAQ